MLYSSSLTMYSAKSIRRELSDCMEEYGFRIIATPITDIDPANSVKNAMNEINRQDRLKRAAEHEGETHRVLQVCSLNVFRRKRHPS